MQSNAWIGLFIYFNGDNDQDGFDRTSFKVKLVDLRDGSILDAFTTNPGPTFIETIDINTPVYSNINFGNK